MIALRSEPRAMDAQTDRAIRAFVGRLENRHGIRDTILFGSRARQTHRSDSDADLAVILEGAASDRSAVVREMAAIAFDVLLDTDILVDAFPLWEDELQRPEAFDAALIRWLERDGLRLASTR